MKINRLPPIEYLSECFDYDKDTGVLTWQNRPESHFVTQSKHKRFSTLSAGKEVGTVDGSGYKVVMLTYKGEHKSYRVHRICYALCFGDTDKIIDHINGDRQDNRISNLRAVDYRINVANQSVPKSSGLKGACWDKNKKRWVAQISVNYRKVHLGRFDTESEAHAAYVEAAEKFNTTELGEAL